MHRIIYLLFISFVFACNEPSSKVETDSFTSIMDKELFQNADIIFQVSKSSQSKAIQLATGSKYSHMGIIYKNNGSYYVFEAIQPVKLTPLETWINRGENAHFVVKRLKSASQLLNESSLGKMKEVGNRYLNKDYDIYFEWSDDRIYCSELVWKVYKEALDVEIGKLQKLHDFDLSNPVVSQKLKERYGNDIPTNEKVISPGEMFNSPLLKTISEG